jgi:hypothetical protein
MSVHHLKKPDSSVQWREEKCKFRPIVFMLGTQDTLHHEPKSLIRRPRNKPLTSEEVSARITDSSSAARNSDRFIDAHCHAVATPHYP